MIPARFMSPAMLRSFLMGTTCLYPLRLGAEVAPLIAAALARSL